MPDYTDALVSVGSRRTAGCFDGLINDVVLVIGRELLHGTCAFVLEEEEVLENVQEPAMLEDAF